MNIGLQREPHIVSQFRHSFISALHWRDEFVHLDAIECIVRQLMQELPRQATLHRKMRHNARPVEVLEDAGRCDIPVLG